MWKVTNSPRRRIQRAIADNEKVNYAKMELVPVKVKGKLTMHGESKRCETDGKVTVQGGKITAIAGFSVLLADFKISDSQAQVLIKLPNGAINVTCALEPLKG